MKVNRTILKRSLIILVSMMLVLICFILVHAFHLGEEAAVGIFSLAATLVGTIFIAIELKNSQEVTCCDMLIDQNNYFHDNDHLMKVYEALERSQGAQVDMSVWKDVEETDIACYCTFFENLYLLYRHKIARLEDLDDLFGYRFFIFTNNPYIQERHLLPTSSSYNEIFSLYEAWLKFRRKNGSHIPGEDYAFSTEFLEKRLYLRSAEGRGNEPMAEFGNQLKISRMGFKDIPEILSVQQRACDQMADPNQFYPLSRQELIESLFLDTVLGAVALNGQLAGFAVFVSCRDSSRNLGPDADLLWQQSYTFDVVVSDPAWRGNGIQRQFIDLAIMKAREAGAKAILATVSPTNSFSLDNFLKKGFTVLKSGMNKYGGLERSLLIYQL